MEFYQLQKPHYSYYKSILNVESPPLEVLIEGPVRKIYPVVYDDADKSLILKAAMLTKGGSGPPGLDADGWRRMLSSREFGTSSTDLRKTFAQLIKRLCIEELETTTSLEAFTAYRLIPLHKKPGLRPIGVGEVLRRIAGNVIIMILNIIIITFPAIH